MNFRESRGSFISWVNDVLQLCTILSFVWFILEIFPFCWIKYIETNSLFVNCVRVVLFLACRFVIKNYFFQICVDFLWIFASNAFFWKFSQTKSEIFLETSLFPSRTLISILHLNSLININLLSFCPRKFWFKYLKKPFFMKHLKRATTVKTRVSFL